MGEFNSVFAYSDGDVRTEKVGHRRIGIVQIPQRVPIPPSAGADK